MITKPGNIPGSRWWIRWCIVREIPYRVVEAWTCCRDIVTEFPALNYLLPFTPMVVTSGVIVMNDFRQIPASELPDTEEDFSISGPLMVALRELMDMVISLVETGATNFLDIKSLPLSPGDLEKLRTVLGEGEVEVIVNALGPTHIHETSVPGVWWVTHKNSNEEVISEFIEVTSLPEILLTQHEELWHSADVMEGRLKEFGIEP